jgi:hypothetical protein
VTVLVVYIPTPEGEAAFSAGLDEANRRGEGFAVPNSPRGGAPINADAASFEAIGKLRARAETAGVAKPPTSLDSPQLACAVICYRRVIKLNLLMRS